MADASIDRNLFDLGVAATPTAATPGQAEYVEGRAVIAYESILDAYDVTITASTEDEEYPGESVRDRLTYGGWRPTGGGEQTLTFTGTQGHTVDYLLIAGHDLSSKGAIIDFQYSDDGSAWTSALSGGHMPTSDKPFMLLFSSASKNHFRLVVHVSGAQYPTIAVVMAGERLSLQRGIYVGHAPARYNRDVNYLTEESEGGQILGRSVLRRANTTSVAMSRITPTWFRSHLDPFFVACEEQPFGFMWNTDDRYKGEVIFGTMTNQPNMQNEHQSFVACELEIRGLA